MALTFTSRRTLLVAVATVIGAFACNPQCDRNPDQAPIAFRSGTTDERVGVYQSAPWTGPFIDFPPGRTYRFFHRLGAAPCDIGVAFSFDQQPFAKPQEDPKGGTVPGAGNQATIENVTAEYFDLRNDTCSDVFLRVTASKPSPMCASTSVEAGAAPGDGSVLNDGPDASADGG